MYLCEIKIGKTYRGIWPAGGREKQREQIKREREVALVERGNGIGRNDHWWNQHLSIFRNRNKQNNNYKKNVNQDLGGSEIPQLI
jgi:hypothetical protein